MNRKILLVFLLVSLFAPSLCFAADYTIDASHTSVSFRIKHLGISYVNGSFAELEGSFSFDPKNIGASKAEVKISAASINTDNKQRDDHLKNPDFFHVEKYPFITFESKEIKDIKEHSFKVMGDLTMHGITKSVELNAVFNGAVKDPWGKERIAFSASAQVNRRDFGLTWSKLLETGGLVVGDEVKITIEVEGIKK